ncbi:MULTISPECIES: hypothetical protein [Sphingobacterium]|uniref:Lipocalin-like domain-containing protein n=1 Tax=Sphingobacterium litopenaei TaxID=2763500 RepID=A0ABR7YEW0_9SPHI|nr:MULTISPECIES: hypothetical protein [Sphingobacterium]MBD1429858.1 hypothetical protein [Sphingobacterium litopenaei]NGM73707.1 hypothetical protein [Sphingobacterium sp. SGL-16]
MKRVFLSFLFVVLACDVVFSQEKPERNSVDINEIEVWTKNVQLSTKGDTATVELYLQSYLKNPREFKLNTFSTGLVNGSEKPLWYHSMQMGKVRVHIDDRQNYLHYLLTRNEPVVLTIKTGGWKKQWGKPKQLKLAIEDFEEQGKILEYTIDL